MRSLSLLIVFLCALPSVFYAQNASDVHRYATDHVYGDAWLLSTGGAMTMFYGSIGNAMLNPAAAALAPSSGFSFGGGLRSGREETSVSALNATGKSSRQSPGISDLSYLYKLPTSQGSLVLGWSLNRVNDFNREMAVEGFNNASSITDRYVRDPFYYQSAWDVYAVDSVAGVPTPVWRIGAFQGVHQEYRLRESGSAHELNFFWGTEFAKGFFVGASAIVPFGRYQYNATMIEPDYENRYNNRTLGNDISDFVSQDIIESRFRGAYFRLGAILRPVDWLSLSATYRSVSRINISENYETKMQSLFDNNDKFTSSLTGDIEYVVRSPARWSFGSGVTLGDFQVGVTGEWTNYADSRISFDASVFDRELALLQRNINAEVTSDFRNTLRLSGALSYKLPNNVSVRAGYAIVPDQRVSVNANMKLYSAGVTWELSRKAALDFGLRLQTFSDRNIVYSTPQGAFVTQGEIRQINSFTSIRFGF
jgi:hypothetical protein